MLLTIRCARCGATMQIPETARGTTRKCPSCLRPVTAPPAQAATRRRQNRGELGDWAVWGLAAAAIGILVVFLWLGLSNSPHSERRVATAAVDESTAADSIVVRHEAAAEQKVVSQPQSRHAVVDEQPRLKRRKTQATIAVAATRRVGMKPQAPSKSPAAIDWPALKPFNQNARWQAPQLSDANYSKWIAFIRPSEKDLKWRKIRWHKSLSVAADEARRLQRPILLWTMNGHPCGET